MDARPVEPLPYSTRRNDDDWIHKLFLHAFANPRLANVNGVKREHSLYGPCTTRMAWIYPPSHHFLQKPQALFWPEVTPDTGVDPDTSISSIEAIDGDVSMDSMLGQIASQQRDVFVQRNRQEVDLLVAKVLDNHNNRQVVLAVVELKRDDLEVDKSIAQIVGYFERALLRLNALDARRPVYALLVLGETCVRLEGKVHNGEPSVYFPDGFDENNQAKTISTDSVKVNQWLVNQAAMWANKNKM